MSERPKDAAGPAVDPDATAMLPRGSRRPEPDPDSTVMIPPRSEDPDPDATIAISARPKAPTPDSDATVMIAADDLDPDATIAIPTPGRRREVVPPPPPPPAPTATGEARAPEIGPLGGLNSLIAAANPVLAVVAQIRHALRHADPTGLRASLAASVKAFEQAARAGGVREQAVPPASFALCCLVDESAAHTPWGASWNSQGLLSERHPGRSRADFALLLEQAMADPAGNLELLEFFAVCLALGYEGEPAAAIADLRRKLHALLNAQRPAYDGQLSGKWRGVAAPLRRPPGALGPWAAACCGALLLVGEYAGFSLSLGARSDPIARDIAQLKIEPPAPRAAPKPAPVPDIAARLAPEIGRGEVAVTDSAGTSTIVIRSDQLFASGSALIEPALEPIVSRIAEALDKVPGTIVVTGHTDDVPIRTARFPSNWELSTERAASVVRLMAEKLAEPKRLRAEGLADSAPLAANDSTANRARNRRVAIILRGTP